jgi:hypothetical protein
MSRRRRHAFTIDMRNSAFLDFDIEIGGRETRSIRTRRDQHIGQDRDRIPPFDNGLDVAKGFQQCCAFYREFHVVSVVPPRCPETRLRATFL